MSPSQPSPSPPSRRADDNICAIPGCRNTARGIICRPCWLDIPQPLRDDYNADRSRLAPLARAVMVQGEIRADDPEEALAARRRLDRALGRPETQLDAPEGLTHAPAIYLSNIGSARTPGHHGPGRRLLIMANPRRDTWLRADGVCLAGCPPSRRMVQDVLAGRLAPELYRVECELRWATASANHLHRGALMAYACAPWYERGQRWGAFPVADGDTLLCSCPRRGSPRRRHDCHRDWLADYLEAAGWRVVLDSQERYYTSGRMSAAAGVDLRAPLPALPGTTPAPAATVDWTPPALIDNGPRAPALQREIFRA